MPYIVNNNGISCRWVDASENYKLKAEETFSDDYPVLQAPPIDKETDFDKIVDLLVSEGLITQEKADATQELYVTK